MKILLCLITLVLVGSARAADSPAQIPSATNKAIVAAVTAADDERQAASIAGDPSRLDAILSSELRYAHSNGKVDAKASYMESLVSHQTVYESFEYQNRTFLPAGPGVVLMSGRVLIRVRTGEQKVTNDLNYLAVWREENGHWRFLAWQSCKNPPPAPAAAAK